MHEIQTFLYTTSGQALNNETKRVLKLFLANFKTVHDQIIILKQLSDQSYCGFLWTGQIQTRKEIKTREFHPANVSSLEVSEKLQNSRSPENIKIKKIQNSIRFT